MTHAVPSTTRTKPGTKPSSVATAKSPRPALVVFGTDSLNKPHASWFAADEQEAAGKAAAVMGFRTLLLSQDAHVQLAQKLPRGRLFDGGRAFVPFIKHALHEKLTALAGEQTKAAPPAPSASAAAAGNGAAVAPAQGAEQKASGSVASPPAQASGPGQRRPKHWDDIKVGDLVLAYDREVEGWFEAIVLAAEGDVLRLRWRDYPLESLGPQRRDQLALLPLTA